MFDTVVTIVGNAITAPEWRRLQNHGPAVANFKVASTSRRYDKDTGRWVDGPSLRVRVTCWRRLAEGVAASVFTGDPVIVTGRMYTRDWIAEDGQHRVSYELDAIAVGHDLARGIGTFQRHRASTATSAVEDAASDARIAGARSEPASSSEPSEPSERAWRSGGHPGASPRDTPSGQNPPHWRDDRPAVDGRSEPGIEADLGYDQGDEPDGYARDVTDDLDDVLPDPRRPDGGLDVLDASSPVDETGIEDAIRPAAGSPVDRETGVDDRPTGQPGGQPGSLAGFDSDEPAGQAAGSTGGRRRRARATVPA